MTCSFSSAYDRPAWDRVNCPFSRRLQELVTDPASLANYLGCTVQAVNQYKTNAAFPKTENLIKIAEYYQVSLDYLMGFTNIPNRDTSLQAINEVTGLDVDAIIKLNEIKEKNAQTSFSDIISLLISDKNAEYFLYMIKLLIDYELGDGGNALVDVHVAGENWKLYSDTLVKASLQNTMIENISAIAARYSAIKQGEAMENGKHKADAD